MRRQSLRYIGRGVGLGLAVALTWAHGSPSYAQEGACVPAPAGMTGWWPGNGNGNDLVGNNTALVDNNISFGAGEVGQAFNFQGAHNGVKVAGTTRLDSRLGFTIEAWINPATPGPDQPIFEWNNNTTFGAHLWTHEQNGELWANIMGVDGTSHIFNSAPGVLTANTFQHVALVYERATGSVAIYHNGAVVAQAKYPPFRPQTTGFDFYLGYRPAGVGAGQRFIGLMDEVGAYGRPLAPAEIQRIYQAGKAGKCPPAGVGGAAPAVVRTTTGAPATAPILPPGAAASGLPRITGAPVGAATGAATGTGVGGGVGTGIGAAPVVPTPVPTPVPPPTPIPMRPRPVATGSMAVLDFSVEQGLDPALGHAVSDALATALQKGGFDIKTRQEVEQSLGGTPTANKSPQPPYNLATQNRLAQAVGAGSVLVGRVVNLESNKGKAATLQLEVSQIQAGTGVLINSFTISETLPTKGQAVPETQLVHEVLQQVATSTLKSLKRAQ